MTRERSHSIENFNSSRRDTSTDEGPPLPKIEALKENGFMFSDDEDDEEPDQQDSANEPDNSFSWSRFETQVN
jgi:hypothetical protein